MLTIFLALIVIIFTAIYIYIKITSNQCAEFWKSRGVPFYEVTKAGSIYQRLTFKISIAQVDRIVYSHFKSLKVPFGGIGDLMTPSLYIVDLDLIKRICVKDFDHFTERNSFKMDKTEPCLNRGITNLSGREWHQVRSILSPTFSTGKIKRMFQFFNASAQNLVLYLKKRIQGNENGQGNVVDFQDTFGRFTVDVIASVGFGLRKDNYDNNSIFREMAKKFQALKFFRILRIFVHAVAPPLASLLRLKITDPESTNFFTNVARQAIEERRSHKSGEKRNDFLQLMLEAQATSSQATSKSEEQDLLDNYEKDALLPQVEPDGQTGGGTGHGKTIGEIMDDNTMIAQCLVFFSAGADTIEVALSFCSYLIAIHPDVQEKLAQEIIQTMESHDGDLTYEATHSMQYLDMVLAETLRIYSPAIFTERHCTKEYTIPETNVIIPVGTRVVIPIGSIHKDPEYYPDPEKFNPENFSAANKLKRHPYSFIPFGQGPRNCIAMRFALTEAKAALAHLIYNFKIEPCDKTQIPIKINAKQFLTKPADGVYLKFIPRNND